MRRARLFLIGIVGLAWLKVFGIVHIVRSGGGVLTPAPQATYSYENWRQARTSSRIAWVSVDSIGLWPHGIGGAPFVWCSTGLGRVSGDFYIVPASLMDSIVTELP